MRRILFFLLGFYKAFGQTDSTVVCLPCNQIKEDQAFVRLKKTIATRPIRIVHIGDSHIQISHFSKQIRDRFTQYVELAGSGISFPYSMAKSVDGPYFKTKSSGSWVGDNILSSKPKLDLALTGYSVRTLDTSASIKFQLRDSKFKFQGVKVWYHADSLSYLPDLGDSFQLKELVHAEQRMGFAYFVKKSEIDQFELKLIKKDTLQREFQLHGIELVNSDDQFIYHALGVAGAQFAHLIHHTERWKEQLRLLNPDLLIFSFGTNEAYNANFDAASFVKQASRFFDDIRVVLPSVSILVTSPPDTRSRNRIPAKQVDVIEGQSQLKASFYDLNKVMGGFGSFQPWFDHEYFLKDKLHLSKSGYQLQADLFSLALIRSLMPQWDIQSLQQHVEKYTNLLLKNKYISDSLAVDTFVIRPKKRNLSKSLFHKVKKGDTFYSIAKRYHISLEALEDKNRRLKSKSLHVGDRIRIK